MWGGEGEDFFNGGVLLNGFFNLEGRNSFTSSIDDFLRATWRDRELKGKYETEREGEREGDIGEGEGEIGVR